MGQAYDKFPKTSVGAHQPEQIWRDHEMFNIHINAHKQRWLKDAIDIIDCHRFKDDFCNDLDTLDRWQLNESPSGSGVKVEQCVDMVNGVFDFDTNGEDDAYGELTQPCECWKLVSCYPLYGEIRFKLSDVTQCDFWFGYIQTHSWFTAPNNYAVFHKDDNDAFLDFANRLAGGTATSTTAILTLVNDTWYRLGIHWDGDGTIRYFVIQDGDFPQTILETGSHTSNIPTTELALGFGIRAGAAAIKHLYVDYIKSSQRRVIEA